jgi:transcriptional regulator GlxA family with amidase domain
MFHKTTGPNFAAGLEALRQKATSILLSDQHLSVKQVNVHTGVVSRIQTQHSEVTYLGKPKYPMILRQKLTYLS